MNEFYALLIVGVSTSALVALSLLIHSNSADIQSVTRSVENGKSVYEIELVKNNNQYFDVIVDPSAGNVSKINDTI